MSKNSLKRPDFLSLLFRRAAPAMLLLAGAASGWSGEARPQQRLDWERTLRAARKGKQVVFYASDRYGELFQEFQKKFPDIKVVSVLGLGPQTIQRIMAEQRAGKFLGDIYLGGATSGYRVLYKGKALDPLFGDR